MAALNINLALRHAGTETCRAIYAKYVELDLLPEGIDDANPLPFNIVKLQRSKLRQYLGLDSTNFNLVTMAEIRDEDNYILDRANNRILPSLEELAFLVDGLLLPESGRGLITRALDRLTDHARAAKEHVQCTICARLTPTFSMLVFDQCGHGACTSCVDQWRENERLAREQSNNQQQRLDRGRHIHLMRFSTRPLGNGFAAIDYLDQNEFTCPICRQIASKAIKCFF